jgi:propionate CoA-transferase
MRSGVVAEGAALLRLVRWGARALARPDPRDAVRVRGNAKFQSALDAVRRIPDGAVVAVSGLGGHQRASLVYRALRAAFEETGHPRGLTLVNVGGHGGRGLVPGTLEELARPGLVTRLFTSHFETFRDFLALAAEGRCELQCLPLGVIAELYAAQARGEDSVLSAVGVGTFLDPRVGRGTPVQGGRRAQWVAAEGDRLRYRLPPIDVAIFNLPAADRRGNLYAKRCAMVGDSREIARAARRHRGLVIAQVGLLVDEGYDRVFLPARAVDAVVCHPDTEQTVGFFHRDPWLAVTARSRVPIGEGLDHARRVRHLAELAGGFPRRSPVHEAVVRLAAATLEAELARGARVAIGTGLPEEVPCVLHERGRAGAFTFLVESGAIGGVPAPGAYFGASFQPRRIVSTAALFAFCRRRLDAACLGAVEIDGRGDVNVSRRARGVRGTIGPGGFLDFAQAARALVFVSGWARGGEIAVEDGAIRIRRRGRPKLVARVAERCFDAARALADGKRIFYVTPVGVFRRVEKGLELARVMPGIDVRRDVLDAAPAPISLPPSGLVPVVDRAIVTGADPRR